jgi:ribonuclease T1
VTSTAGPSRLSGAGRLATAVLLALALVALAVLLFRPGGSDGRRPSIVTTPTAPAALPPASLTTSVGGGRVTLDEQTPSSGLPTIALGDLPDEALAVLDAIAVGGPFRYEQDGSTFRNREGILPPRRVGYYREYTVRTPGEGDRGARRIIAGSSGDLYYTEDHYASFRQIEESG